MRRSVEYGIIFILLLFVTLFAVEVFSSRRIHPIQYALVAAAITVFYVLLLALSEHMLFGYAYLLASVATYALLVVYLNAFITHTTTFRVITILLALTFAFFYILLQLEDYAVLAGSLAIFCVLAFIMVYTRRVDWYALQQGE